MNYEKLLQELAALGVSPDDLQEEIKTACVDIGFFVSPVEEVEEK